MFDENSRLKMLAWTPGDAMAYVKTLNNGKIWVISPYHKIVGYEEIDEDTVAIAVVKHGFELMEMEFENLAALDEFLGKKLVETRRAMGFPEPSSERIKDLICFAPPDMVERMLDRVEKELIPNGEFKTVKSLLTDLTVKTPAVKESLNLQQRIQNLLAKCP